jgi:hypothetical protein
MVLSLQFFKGKGFSAWNSSRIKGFELGLGRNSSRVQGFQLGILQGKGF